MEKAFPDLNANVAVDGSKSIALSFYDENQNEKIVQNSSRTFIFSIPKDIAHSLAPFIYLSNNSSNSSATDHANFLVSDGFLLNKQNVSIHYQISPNDFEIGYFVALKFGGKPYLNENLQSFDMWTIFCPVGMQKFDLINYFSNHIIYLH